MVLALEDIEESIEYIRDSIFESQDILPTAKHDAFMILFKIENGFNVTNSEMAFLKKLIKFMEFERGRSP